MSFRDDRSVVRRVTAEFYVPDEAPIFRADDGQPYRLIPLSVMRRKTLVNFQIRDEENQPVVLPSLRQNQAITESLLLACADAVTAAHGNQRAEHQWHIEDFIHRIVSGNQRELVDAYDSLAYGGAPMAVRELAGEQTFKAILDRMADNFVLWVMTPAGGRRRRVVTFSCDEPLYLHYRASGHERSNPSRGGRTDTYRLGPKLKPWHPAVVSSALGLTPTRIHFPVPAAENAASFHFEIDAPEGVQIVEASLLAGPPGHSDPSFDHVQGSFPTVGLHVIEVPNGSLSRVQIGLQVANSGWLLTSMFTCWAVFAFMLALALHVRALRQASDLLIPILIALAAAAAGFVAQRDAHPLATRLLKWARSLALVAGALPLVAVTFIVFQSVAPTHVAPALWSATGVSGAIALLLLVGCVRSWWRLRKSIRSPWEQDRTDRHFPSPPERFEDAEATYRYNMPAMRVESAEGWHKDFRWNKETEQELLDRLRRPLRHLRYRPPAQPWWPIVTARRQWRTMSKTGEWKDG